MTSRSQPSRSADLDEWYAYGDKCEEHFVNHVALAYGINCRLNPEKKENKKAHDILILADNGMEYRADYKGRFVPFFTAGHYRIDPWKAVTINYKDVDYYTDVYGDGFWLIFHIDWRGQKRYGIKVARRLGVFVIKMGTINRLITMGQAHTIKTSDGQSSYLFSLDHAQERKLLEGCTQPTLL